MDPQCIQALRDVNILITCFIIVLEIYILFLAMCTLNKFTINFGKHSFIQTLKDLKVMQLQLQNSFFLKF